MPDVYVYVAEMAYSKDPTKVAAKYATNAKQLLRSAAVDAIRASAGFVPDTTGKVEGFYFDATLTEVAFGTYQGQPSVTCKLNGVLATYPQKRWITKTLTGKATLAGGTTDRDVQDCIRAAIKDTITKAVIPTLKQQAKK